MTTTCHAPRFDIIRSLLLATVLPVLPVFLPLLWGAEDAGVGAAVAGPSVLLLNHGSYRLDFNYLRALHRRGFQLDYCDPKAKDLAGGKLAERLRRYHVVVLIQADDYRALFDRDGIKNGMEHLVKVLAAYAEEGGGVFLMPNPITWDIDGDYQSFTQLTRRVFGAGYPVGHWLLDTNPDNHAKGGLKPRDFAWTDRVTPHEVTRGVNGVWYSLATYRNNRCTTNALVLEDPAWTVVLKGSATAQSLNLAEYWKLKKVAPSTTALRIVGTDRAMDSEPPLMAARSMGKGRVAFLPMDDIDIWCDGYRHIHGGNDEDNSPGIPLGGTLKGRTSNLETLIDNTLRWLAAPAVTAGVPGGYVQDPARLAAVQPMPQPPLDWTKLKFPSERTSAADLQGEALAELKKAASYQGMENALEQWKSMQQWDAKPYTGLLGARSTLSDGTTSVADMIAAAREAKLDFLVFLERFDLLTPQKLEALTQECAAACTDTLLVLPGYTVDDNRNHSLYVFGPRQDWPQKWLTADGKQFNTAATEGGSGLNALIDFLVSKVYKIDDMGYYRFAAKTPDRQFRGPMYDLRLYSSVGLYYYDSGKLVEGPEQNLEAYKDVNDLVLGIKPYAIDIVRSPDELRQAVREHVLTRVLANHLKDVADVLAYNYRMRESSVSVSPRAGPEILQWTCQNRDYSCIPLRPWVTPNYRWRVECAVASADGLDTIEIWDGVELFRRIRVNGEKVFHHIFDLSHRQQQQLILVVTDVKGRTAYSGAVQDGNHVSQHYFCADRINGALFHGPYGNPRMNWGVQEGRKFKASGYDGFLGLSASLYFGAHPQELDLGVKETFAQGFGGAHPYLYLWNEEASICSTTSGYGYAPGEKVVHAWYTYGPLVARECTGTVGWRFEGCGGLVKQENFVTLKRDGQINHFPSQFIDYRNMGVLPGNGTVFACSAAPDQPVYSFNIPAELPKLERLIDSDYRIGKGGFAACHGTVVGSGGCALYFRDDYKRRLIKGGGYSFVATETIPAGTSYKTGDVLVARTLQIGGYRPDCSGGASGGRAPDVNGGWWYQRVADWLGLDGTANIQLQLKAGKQMPVTDGFCDVSTDKQGYADMTFAPDTKAPLAMVGVRLIGGNDRWSMMRYQPKLPYVDSVETYQLRYVVRVKREVEDGLKPLGSWNNTGYLTVDLPKPGDDPLRILAGHPVTASDRRVFVQVTALSWQPYTYAVSVNNPTDETLTVKLKPGLPLPNFAFSAQTITLKPGELKEIVPN